MVRFMKLSANTLILLQNAESILTQNI